MPDFPRPRVLASRCLGFDRCRYNGEMIDDEFVARLGKWADYVTVCPEVEMGLGVPRQPVRLVEAQGKLRLVQPATGRDLTGDMAGFIRGFTAGLTGVDGMLFKSRSPSCGPLDVRIYAEGKPGSPSRRGRGIFAAAMMERFPLLAVEHEGRVLSFHLREHFLTKLFAFARLREMAVRPRARALVEFQAANKLLLMAYNQTAMRQMGRLVSAQAGQDPGEAHARYAALLGQALARPPRGPAVINALMHALGYFKKALGPKEKAYFLDLLEQYRAGRAPLLLLQGLLTAWSLQFEVVYLQGQSFFQPYPRELFDLADSGKGRQLD